MWGGIGVAAGVGGSSGGAAVGTGRDGVVTRRVAGSMAAAVAKAEEKRRYACSGLYPGGSRYRELSAPGGYNANSESSSTWTS